ncbi:MAG: hypothetical protein ACK559_23995, partial [bacterium]
CWCVVLSEIVRLHRSAVARALRAVDCCRSTTVSKALSSQPLSPQMAAGEWRLAPLPALRR